MQYACHHTICVVHYVYHYYSVCVVHYVYHYYIILIALCIDFLYEERLLMLYIYICVYICIFFFFFFFFYIYILGGLLFCRRKDIRLILTLQSLTHSPSFFLFNDILSFFLSFFFLFFFFLSMMTALKSYFHPLFISVTIILHSSS